MIPADVLVEVLGDGKGDQPPAGCALKPATVPDVVGADPGDTHVVVDGDTVATPVLSLIGALVAESRVMVLFWPPHGAYVIGVLGVPAGAGPWQAVTFNTGWSNLGGGAQEVQYRIQSNTVKLRGVCQRTSGALTVMFTLPSGYAPQAQEIFAAASGGEEHANVEVNADGTVEWFPSDTATATYVSVSGISFDPYDYV